MKYYNVILAVILFFTLTCKRHANKVDDGLIEEKTTKEVNNEKAYSEPSVDFSLEEIKLNEIKIFNLNKDELIKFLDLTESDEQKGFAYFHGVNKFEISDNRIVYFGLKDSDFVISNPDLSVGMNESELKMKFPQAYSRLTDDDYNNIKLKSFEMYDINDNKLRVYIKDGKILSISYFAFENL